LLTRATPEIAFAEKMTVEKGQIILFHKHYTTHGLFSAGAEIIARQPSRRSGIVGLVSLIVGFVVLPLVRRNDPPSVRLFAIVIVMLFCGGLMTTVETAMACPTLRELSNPRGSPTISSFELLDTIQKWRYLRRLTASY